MVKRLMEMQSLHQLEEILEIGDHLFSILKCLMVLGQILALLPLTI